MQLISTPLWCQYSQSIFSPAAIRTDLQHLQTYTATECEGIIVGAMNRCVPVTESWMMQPRLVRWLGSYTVTWSQRKIKWQRKMNTNEPLTVFSSLTQKHRCARVWICARMHSSLRQKRSNISYLFFRRNNIASGHQRNIVLWYKNADDDWDKTRASQTLHTYWQRWVNAG